MQATAGRNSENGSFDAGTTLVEGCGGCFAGCGAISIVWLPATAKNCGNLEDQGDDSSCD